MQTKRRNIRLGDKEENDEVEREKTERGRERKDRR
jgi:hypothetical protein